MVILVLCALLQKKTIIFSVSKLKKGEKLLKLNQYQGKDNNSQRLLAIDLCHDWNETYNVTVLENVEKLRSFFRPQSQF